MSIYCILINDSWWRPINNCRNKVLLHLVLNDNHNNFLSRSKYTIHALCSGLTLSFESTSWHIYFLQLLFMIITFFFYRNGTERNRARWNISRLHLFTISSIESPTPLHSTTHHHTIPNPPIHSMYISNSNIIQRKER